jgi:hypothetical protein
VRVDRDAAQLQTHRLEVDAGEDGERVARSAALAPAQ